VKDEKQIGLRLDQGISADLSADRFATAPRVVARLPQSEKPNPPEKTGNSAAEPKEAARNRSEADHDLQNGGAKVLSG